MASYHLSCKTVSRSSGRSATAAAAYRAGERIADDRTGDVHDYSRKSGVVASMILAPAGVEVGRAELWNMAELAENRKNSTVAREWEVALPVELDPDQQLDLAREFAADLVDRYQVAADVCIHRPDPGEHSNDNPHAHILTTTRSIDPDGLGKKTRVLDDRKTGSDEVNWARERWADLQNDHLSRAGSEARVDHRSLADQGKVHQLPHIHLGPAATSMERRGIQTDRGDINRQVDQINLVAGNLAMEVQAMTEPVEEQDPWVEINRRRVEISQMRQGVQRRAEIEAQLAKPAPDWRNRAQHLMGRHPEMKALIAERAEAVDRLRNAEGYLEQMGGPPDSSPALVELFKKLLSYVGLGDYHERHEAYREYLDAHQLMGEIQGDISHLRDDLKPEIVDQVKQEMGDHKQRREDMEKERDGLPKESDLNAAEYSLNMSPEWQQIQQQQNQQLAQQRQQEEQRQRLEEINRQAAEKMSSGPSFKPS